MNERLNYTAWIAWLDAATKNLPANLAGVTRGELEAHYLDACEAYQREGLAPEQAAAKALADLGDASLTAAGLRAAHLSRGQALLAMLACLVYPAVLVSLPSIYAALGENGAYLVQDGVNAIALIFILLTFIRLVGFGAAHLANPGRLLIAGILLELVDRAACVAVYGHLPLFGPGDALTWHTGSALALGMDWAFVGSQLLIAAGAAWMGYRLLRMEDALFGLQKAAGSLLLLTGPIGLMVAAAILDGSEMYASLFSVLGYAVVTLLLALMLLIFFRAAFRAEGLPMQAE